MVHLPGLSRAVHGPLSAIRLQCSVEVRPAAGISEHLLLQVSRITLGRRKRRLLNVEWPLRRRDIVFGRRGRPNFLYYGLWDAIAKDAADPAHSGKFLE